MILKNILDQIKTSEYALFDPILILQKIINHCVTTKQYNFTLTQHIQTPGQKG